jgi:hypothetical protein
MKTKNTIRKVLAIGLIYAVCVSSIWAEAVVEKPVIADTPEKFAATVDELHQAMQPGGRYEFIKGDKKVDAESDMAAMTTLLQKAGSVAAMREDDKVSLFNTQEHLNGILTQSDRNRLVCKHRAPTGTIIPVTTCLTVAEIEKNNADSKNFMQAVQLKQVVPLSGVAAH